MFAASANALGSKNAKDEPPPEIDKSMSVAHALSVIETNLEHAKRGDTELCVNRQPLQQISVNKDGFQFLDIGKRDRGFWKDDYSVMATFKFQSMPYLRTGPLKGRPGVTRVTNWPTPATSPPANAFISVCVGNFPAPDFFGFIAAVNRLIWEHTPEAAQWRQDEELKFEQTAAAWRAMSPKPPISEEVQKKRLLAEDDVAQKNLPAAIEDYEAGVKLDPTWAQGWFNSALLYAEQQDYESASFNMKRYLILLPDAPDAPAAREKLLLWEARAEKAAGK